MLVFKLSLPLQRNTWIPSVPVLYAVIIAPRCGGAACMCPAARSTPVSYACGMDQLASGRLGASSAPVGDRSVQPLAAACVSRERGWWSLMPCMQEADEDEEQEEGASSDAAGSEEASDEDEDTADSSDSEEEDDEGGEDEDEDMEARRGSHKRASSSAALLGTITSKAVIQVRRAHACIRLCLHVKGIRPRP